MMMMMAERMSLIWKTSFSWEKKLNFNGVQAVANNDYHRISTLKTKRRKMILMNRKILRTSRRICLRTSMTICLLTTSLLHLAHPWALPLPR